MGARAFYLICTDAVRTRARSAERGDGHRCGKHAIDARKPRERKVLPSADDVAAAEREASAESTDAKAKIAERVKELVERKSQRSGNDDSEEVAEKVRDAAERIREVTAKVCELATKGKIEGSTATTPDGRLNELSSEIARIASRPAPAVMPAGSGRKRDGGSGTSDSGSGEIDTKPLEKAAMPVNVDGLRAHCGLVATEQAARDAAVEARRAAIGDILVRERIGTRPTETSRIGTRPTEITRGTRTTEISRTTFTRTEEPKPRTVIEVSKPTSTGRKRGESDTAKTEDDDEFESPELRGAVRDEVAKHIETVAALCAVEPDAAPANSDAATATAATSVRTAFKELCRKVKDAVTKSAGDFEHDNDLETVEKVAEARKEKAESDDAKAIGVRDAAAKCAAKLATGNVGVANQELKTAKDACKTALDAVSKKLDAAKSAGGKLNDKVKAAENEGKTRDRVPLNDADLSAAGVSEEEKKTLGVCKDKIEVKQTNKQTKSQSIRC